MSYSVNALTTVADCDVLLAMAIQRKGELLHRRENITYQKDNNAVTSVELQTELLSVNTELSSVDGIIATLPEGPIKEDYVVKQSRLQWRQKLLNNKKADYGNIAMLDKELELALIDLAIAEVDAFIAAVTAKKATL